MFFSDRLWFVDWNDFFFIYIVFDNGIYYSKGNIVRIIVNINWVYIMF